MMGSDIGKSIRGFSRLYQGSAAVCWENFMLRRDSQMDVWASSASSIVYEAYLWGRGDRLAWLTPPVWHEETGHREVTSPRWSACLSAWATPWDVGHSPLESPEAAGMGRRVVEGRVLEGALSRLPGCCSAELKTVLPSRGFSASYITLHFFLDGGAVSHLSCYY